MARYVGAAVAVAAVAMINGEVAENQREAGESAADALAAGLAASALLMAIVAAPACCSWPLRRLRPAPTRADRPRRGGRRHHPHDPHPTLAGLVRRSPHAR